MALLLDNNAYVVIIGRCAHMDQFFFVARDDLNRFHLMYVDRRNIGRDRLS